MYSEYERRIKSGMVIGSKEELAALIDHWLTIRDVLAKIALTRETDDCGYVDGSHYDFLN